MTKWLGIAVFFIVIVIMYLVLGTDVFKLGEEEDKTLKQEYQQEESVIKEMENPG